MSHECGTSNHCQSAQTASSEHAHNALLQIERWWRELHDRLEKYYKQQLRWLKDQSHYQPENALDRYGTSNI